VETGFPKRSCSTEHERPFHHPPALRRDHHPLRRGRLVSLLSPSSVITGCGAGGGGCVFFLVERGARERVERAIAKAGAQILPVQVAARGVTIRKGSKK